MSTQGILGY